MHSNPLAMICGECSLYGSPYHPLLNEIHGSVRKKKSAVRKELGLKKVQSSTFYDFSGLGCPQSMVDLEVREVGPSARWDMA